MTLEARDISVRIRHHTLVDSISLQVDPGEVVGIIGPNGAGKSTFFKALTGDMRLAGGSINMAGRPLKSWSRAERAKVRGILAQAWALHFAFRVLEVVMMGRAPHINRYETTRDYEIAQAAMQVMEIAHLQDRPFTTLSGGEQQRVHLARVFAQIWDRPKERARYLLMDEPTNNLDLRHQHITLKRARMLAAQNTAVLVILHDLNLAAHYADRLAVIADGQLLAIGDPRTVLTAEMIRTVFQMNVMITPHPQRDIPVILPQLEIEFFPQI